MQIPWRESSWVSIRVFRSNCSQGAHQPFSLVSYLNLHSTSIAFLCPYRAVVLWVFALWSFVLFLLSRHSSGAASMRALIRTQSLCILDLSRSSASFMRLTSHLLSVPSQGSLWNGKKHSLSRYISLHASQYILRYLGPLVSPRRTGFKKILQNYMDISVV